MTATVAPVTLTKADRYEVRRPRMVRNSLTMAWRATVRLRREPEQAFDAIAIPVLFTLLFTYLFGGALSGSPREYLRFLLPGTLVLTVLLITVTAGLSLNTDRAQGTLDRFRSMPIWQPSVIVGGLMGTWHGTCSRPAWSWLWDC
jgi:ABC-2 type transport system permease protein